MFKSNICHRENLAMNSINPSQQKSIFRLNKYSDVILAVGVLVIMALMVLKLPTSLIDALVGVNIAAGIGLLLIAIYIPAPVAFNSFPSVLLISTLFRLALSVATTRLILLDANAGEIINAFGNFVAGGNLVVGIVVFIIITVVQFIVIAKGAERVAEVAARFTLDAMPGKQMSIDSDLRSGLIDKDEAKRRRTLLAQESQLNGALDGAMKFVKGDAIASIIIVFVNLTGGLTIGVLQNGYSAGEAMQIYSILTIGDGMVAQIPALLGAMAAGLFVTRTTGGESEKNLGDAIGQQIFSQPRAIMMTGVIAFLLALVPGFPSLVFMGLAVTLIFVSYFISPQMYATLMRRKTEPSEFIEGQLVDRQDLSSSIKPLRIELGETIAKDLMETSLHHDLHNICDRFSETMGIEIPSPVFTISSTASNSSYRILLFGVSIADENHPKIAPINPPNDKKELIKSEQFITLESRLETVLKRYSNQFLGIQEVSDIMEVITKQYPALSREVLRIVSLQDLLEVLRNLLAEGIPVRNMRDILGTIVEWGDKEKDTYSLTEFVRIGLKRYMTERYTDEAKKLHAWVVTPALEEKIRMSITQTPAGNLLTLDPTEINQLQQNLRKLISDYISELSTDETVHIRQDGYIKHLVLLTSVDVRRHVRKIFEDLLPDLPILSYQELIMPVDIVNMGFLALAENNK